MNRQGMFGNRAELILASGSPRRKRLLQDIGLDFSVMVPRVPEDLVASETPGGFVSRLARDKARAVAHDFPGVWVLAADTVVVVDDLILGKPVDKEDALQILMRLAGRRHHVLTGFFLGNQEAGRQHVGVVSTEVLFAPFTEAVAAAYVATGEPLDKAGAYGIQGQGGCLVERINGSASNVIGLPLAEVVQELLRFEVIAPGK